MRDAWETAELMNIMRSISLKMANSDFEFGGRKFLHAIKTI